MPEVTQGRRDLDTYARLLREARPFWPCISALLVLQLLATPIALFVPVPLKIVVDSVLGTQPLPGWMAPYVPQGITVDPRLLLVCTVVLLVANALLEYLRILAAWVLSAYAGNKLLVSFRAKLFRHVQELPFAYHDKKGSADSLYRIQYDAVSIQQIATQGVVPFVTSGVTLVAMVWITFRIDPPLALIALGIVPPLYILTHSSRGIIKRQWSSLKGKESAAISVLQETLGALRVVKAFGKEDAAREHFESKSGGVVRDELRLAVTEGGFDLLIAVTIALGTAAVLFVGARHVEQGIITLGDLLLIMGYLAQLYAPLQTITRTVAKLQGGLAGAERAFALLDEQPTVSERKDARPVGRARGELEFRNVEFGYEDGQRVLGPSSFRVSADTRVGIFGPTGAGKTTLVGLLLRFYDPTGGAILLDGVDLRDYVLGDLRRQYGMVLQDSILFSASIAENIAYSRPEAAHSEIVEAAKAANAHDFISALPDGYRTTVGERGMRLSGGERQRISLARAFLRDAPILILDEPTSALDTATEQAIIDALDRLMAGRTTVMIAHRLSTLQSCDVWLRMASGQAAELLHSPPGLPGVPVKLAPVR